LPILSRWIGLSATPPWSAKVYRLLARHAFEISANVVFLVRLNTAIGTTARERDYLDRGHALKEIIPISWQMAGFPQEGFTLAVCHWQRGWQGGTMWNHDWIQAKRSSSKSDSLGAFEWAVDPFRGQFSLESACVGAALKNPRARRLSRNGKSLDSAPEAILALSYPLRATLPGTMAD